MTRAALRRRVWSMTDRQLQELGNELSAYCLGFGRGGKKLDRERRQLVDQKRRRLLAVLLKHRGAPISSASDVERLARILWNISRDELQRGEAGPAFYSYADGAQEPMPFDKQDKDFKQFWTKRARRVLRALRS